LVTVALVSTPPLGTLVNGQASAASQGTWFDLYDQAIEHVNRSEWGQAEKKLLQAKAAGPPAGRRVRRYGVLFTPFFPDYYLGIVYQNTGRPKEALAAFQLARKQDIDTSAREFQQLDTLARAAEATIARASTPVNATPAEPVPTTPVENPPPVEPKVEVPNPPMANPDAAALLRKRFDDLISTAESQMKQRNYAAALASAGQARDLDVDRARAETLIQSIERANLSDTIRAHLQNGDLSAAKLELDRLSRLAPGSPEVGALSESLRVASAKFDAATVRATAERNAMRQFFAGDYQRALNAIASLEQAQPLSPRAYFYRACSLAAIALRSEPVDASRLDDARRNYARALPAGRELQRDRRFISPKILDALAGR
jgi:tetratricopeptide (TPR) repeat protein